MITRTGIRLVPAALVLALAACAGAAPGTRPHDMSVEAHEEAARTEDERATGHGSEYEPDAVDAPRCGGTAALGGEAPCWSADVNPTAEHRAEAASHREAAAAHRAAAEALREVEARECVGLSEADRDQSPFSHREDIASVAELTEEVRVGRGTRTRIVGATIVIRAVPGLSAEWLQRIIECHLARNASLGHDVPEMSYCPLVPLGVTVRVRSVGDGFAVDVRAEGDAEAAEVLRRARSLVAAP